MTLHKSLLAGDIHTLNNWQVADAAALTALAGSLVAGDIGKTAYQTDTKQHWILTDNVAPTWKQVGFTDTASVTEGTNLYFTTARVLATVLTGLSTASNTVVTAAHTILQAIGFLQKQVSDNTASIAAFGSTVGESSASFTPTISGSTTAGSPTYVTQEGYYTLHGKICHFKLRILISAKSTMAGNLVIGGLPFTASTDTANTLSAIAIGYVSQITAISGAISLTGFAAGTTVSFYWQKSSGAAVQTVITDIGTAFDIGLSGWYKTV